MTFQIRNIRTEEWEDAMALVWRTFLKYEACDYEEEGVRSFLDFITDERLKKLHMIGEYPVMAAFAVRRWLAWHPCGASITFRFWFVDSKYHKKGIGTELVHSLRELVLAEGRRSSLTVNAAPYATGFYHKIGFTDTDGCAQKKGFPTRRWSGLSHLLQEIRQIRQHV